MKTETRHPAQMCLNSQISKPWHQGVFSPTSSPKATGLHPPPPTPREQLLIFKHQSLQPGSETKSSERSRLSFLPPSCLRTLSTPLHPVSFFPSHGLANICLCSVFSCPSMDLESLGPKPPCLLAPLSSSLKYVQIFLILKNKNTLDLTSLPTTYFLHSRYSQKRFSILPIATSSRPFPPHPPKSTSSCHFSATALPESTGTFFYLTHRAWADLTAPEHLRPPDLLESPLPMYSVHHTLQVSCSSWVSFPGFLLLTPLPTTPRGDTIRAPSFHLFSSLSIFLLGDPMASLVT